MLTGKIYTLLNHDPVLGRILATNFLLYKNPNLILSAVLCGCEMWPLKLRKEHRLWVFQNRVLRRIFIQKRDEMTGCWRKVHK
jgi:hypothetical protein